MTFVLGRLGAAMLACGLSMTGGAALAQTTPKPAPAPPPGQAPQPSGPVKVELQPMQTPWVKICGKNQDNNKEVCYTTRDFGQAADQPPILAVAIYQLQDDDRRIARFLLPLALMLKPGFRLFIDKEEPLQGYFAFCYQNGCFAETNLDGKMIAKLKKAQTANVVVKNSGNNEVTFSVPMKDFGAVFDGPATDIKALQQQEQQGQQQQQEAEKQLAEKLQKQHELEQQNAQPAPAPQPPK